MRDNYSHSVYPGDHNDCGPFNDGCEEMPEVIAARQETKNNLGMKILLMVEEYNDIKDEPMTEAVGEHARYALRKTFEILQRAGVPIELKGE